MPLLTGMAKVKENCTDAAPQPTLTMLSVTPRPAMSATCKSRRASCMEDVQVLSTVPSTTMEKVMTVGGAMGGGSAGGTPMVAIAGLVWQTRQTVQAAHSTRFSNSLTSVVKCAGASSNYDSGVAPAAHSHGKATRDTRKHNGRQKRSG
eukprot:589372-Prymnesium_polylepis.1